MNKLEMSNLIAKALKARVVFSSISFVCTGWLDEEAFVVRDSDIAAAFMEFREKFPDADLTLLNIYCEK